MSDPTNPDDLAAALRTVETSRADAAARVASPWWVHAWLGLMLGGLTAAFGLPVPMLLAVEALFVLGLVLFIRAYRRRTGVWVNGYRAGRTRWVALTAAVGATLISLTGVWLMRERHIAWAPFVAGVVQFVFVTAKGFVWDAAYRADMRAAAR